TTKATEIKSQPLITVGPNAYLFNACKIMEKNNIRRLPVVKDNAIVGIVTITDIIKHLHTIHKEDHYLLRFMIRYRKYLEE
ncbi:MAG TPA: CBS domain-containing protein, partial [Nitrososphaeraceae archaeon]|nr:CBS domain-containing protein [Nitrososphaeraceae archaeon]